MKKQSLNGIWRYRIGKGKWREREVPFSALAVGHSECEKEFDLEYEAPRVELKLDGITYRAKIFLNGELIGDMLPYCEYAFDITDISIGGIDYSVHDMWAHEEYTVTGDVFSAKVNSHGARLFKITIK